MLIYFVVGCLLNAGLCVGIYLHCPSLGIDCKMCKSEGSQMSLQITQLQKLSLYTSQHTDAMKVGAVTVVFFQGKVRTGEVSRQLRQLNKKGISVHSKP